MTGGEIALLIAFVYSNAITILNNDSPDIARKNLNNAQLSTQLPLRPTGDATERETPKREAITENKDNPDPVKNSKKREIQTTIDTNFNSAARSVPSGGRAVYVRNPPNERGSIPNDESAHRPDFTPIYNWEN